MKKKCMSDKISTLISDNFDSGIGNKLNLPAGNIRISVIFKINSDGPIKDIQARAQHPELEKEAIRVIGLIPKMKPGYFRGKPVTVPYSLPILFKVDGKDNSDENRTFPVYKGCDDELGYEALKKCTSEKIMDYVKVNTMIDDADKLFPTENSTQFQASFFIDTKGKIKNIKVKAHKREMAALVIKAMKQLPKMKAPGTINGKPVDVPFEFLMTLYFD